MNKYLLTGIGNAAIDIVCSVTEEQFRALNLRVPKASTDFLELNRAQHIEATLKGWNTHCDYIPGGSAANTACVLGALGAPAAFIGKTADDTMGQLFTDSIKTRSVACNTAPAPTGETSTTRIFTFITPDSERTFATYYGSSDYLTPQDADEDMIASSECLYIDGYMLASKYGYETLMTAIGHAQAHNKTVIFNPSASSVIHTWPDRVKEIIAKSHGVICNEEEAFHLTGHRDVQKALEALAPTGKFAVITIGQKGSWVRKDGTNLHRPVPDRPIHIVNTNGAGDAFTGGFLYGLTKNWPLAACLDLGTECAIHVLGQTGPRPLGSLVPLLEQFKTV